MGLQQSNLKSDDEIVEAAHAVGLKVYAGFEATERRLLFVQDDKFTPKHKLKTILPTGEQEGDDKKIQCRKDKALVTYPHEQFLDAKQAQPWLDHGRNALVHVWPINFNDEFRKVFDVKEENVEPQYFEDAAAANLMSLAVDLFGEAAKQERIKFCKKLTKNIQRIYIGTTPQFKSFFAADGIKESMAIVSIDGYSVVVFTKN